MRAWLCLIPVILIAGCTATPMQRLTTLRFQPTPKDQPVKLYNSDVTEPHIKLAQIQSFADSSRDTETKRAQLLDLTERARRIGADAVVNVRQLENRVRGMVVDEKVPFRSYQQGRYEMYFLRGVAIRYTDPASADASLNPTAETQTLPAADATSTDIPAIRTEEPEESLRGDFLPFGSGLLP